MKVPLAFIPWCLCALHGLSAQETLGVKVDAQGRRIDQLETRVSRLEGKKSEPSPVETGGFHVVKRGESLWSVARDHGTSVAALKSLNTLKSNVLGVGQKLRLPGGATSVPEEREKKNLPVDKNPPPAAHRVRRGETLSGIASKYHVSVGSIQRLNRLSSPNRIAEGQILKVPGGARPEPEEPPMVYKEPTPPPPTPKPKPKPPRPAPPEPTVMKTVDYVVGEGESARSVAKSLGIPVSRLLQINGISSESQIKQGARIRVPEDALGDSLGSPF